MRMKRLIMFCLSFAMPFLFFGCKKQVTVIADEFFENATRKTLETVRKNPYFGMSEEQKKQRRFYNALYRYDYDRDLENVITFLDSGFDPNYCYGKCGWIDSNPLLLISEIIFIKYWWQGKYEQGKEPDVALIKLLLDYGADIHRYPYVWAMTYRKSNKNLENQSTGQPENLAILIESSFVDDCNRVLRTYLDNGADVNAKGNHIAFDWQTYKEKLPYEEFVKLCNSPEATTPIYEAIKKGMVWESQVDLLLEYGATLDESCREAAKLSGDEAMIQKIEKLLQSRKS